MLDPVQITRHITAIEKRLEFLRIEVPTVGGGGGAIGGTIAATQVAYGTALDTIGGEAAFTYNAATNTLSVGAINVPDAGYIGNAAATARLVFDSSGLTDYAYFLGCYVGAGTATPARRVAVLEADAATNSVTYVARLSHTTSGLAAAGFGVGVEEGIEDAGGTERIAGIVETLWTDAAAATHTAARVWKLASGGAAAAEYMRLSYGLLTVQRSDDGDIIKATDGLNDLFRVGVGANFGFGLGDVDDGYSGGLFSLSPSSVFSMIRGDFGIGTITPAVLFHEVDETATTNAVLEVQRVEARVTGAGVAAAGFGPSVDLYGESATNTNYRQMARIAATWTTATDASRNAALSFETYPAGTAVGHCRFWSGTAIDGTAQTIIANATGDVTEAVTVVYTAAEITGTDTGGGAVTLEPGDTFDICSDGTNTLTLTCAADGSVTIARSAGADTFKAALWLTWI